MRKFILLLICLLSANLFSQTTYYVSKAGDDKNDGKTWETAKKEVQSALDAATFGDAVWVAEGTYYPTIHMKDYEHTERGKSFIVRNGVDLIGGFSGNESSPEQREMEDKDNNGTIEPWEFKHAVILSADYDGSPDEWIWNEEEAEWDIEYNRSNGYHVLFPEGKISRAVKIDGFTISGGNADGSASSHNRGGGVYCDQNMNIHNCIFERNVGEIAGALYNRGYINNCLFVNNQVISRDYAGVIRNDISGKISNVVVRENGGITIWNGEDCMIERMTMYSNSGIRCLYNKGIILNSSIFNNFGKAYTNQVAISNLGEIYNSMIYNNELESTYGSAVVYTSGYLINSIVLFNVARNFQGKEFQNSSYAVNCILPDHFSLSCMHSALISKESGEEDISKNFPITIDEVAFLNYPSFKGLASSKEELEELIKTDFRLEDNSPCIDRGNSLFFWESDYDYKPRYMGAQVDIGPYEKTDKMRELPLEENFENERFLFSGLSWSVRSINDTRQAYFGKEISSYNFPLSSIPVKITQTGTSIKVDYQITLRNSTTDTNEQLRVVVSPLGNEEGIVLAVHDNQLGSFKGKFSHIFTPPSSWENIQLQFIATGQHAYNVYYWSVDDIIMDYTNELPDFVDKIEVNLDDAGTLWEEINNVASTIKDIKITGNIDARDFKTLRDKMPLLKNIDISETSVHEYTGNEGTLAGTVTYDKNEIPPSAFSWQKQGTQKEIQSLLLPLGVTTIGKDAFTSLNQLKSITLPESVHSIGTGSFNFCESMMEIISSNPVPPSLGNIYVFTHYFPTTTCVLYVPVGSKTLYESARGWNEFFHITERDGNPSEVSISKKETILFYPNPVKDLLTIECGEFSKIEIYSATGIRVGEYYSSKITLGNLPSGIYQLIIYLKKEKEVLKFIKQ